MSVKSSMQPVDCLPEGTSLMLRVEYEVHSHKSERSIKLRSIKIHRADGLMHAFYFQAIPLSRVLSNVNKPLVADCGAIHLDTARY